MINVTCPTLITPDELQSFRKAWFKAIEPLLRHMEQSEQVGTLLSFFDVPVEQVPARPGQTIPLNSEEPWPLVSVYLWDFVKHIAHLFPVVLFSQLQKTIRDTRGRDPRRDRRTQWIRKAMMKDLRKCEGRIREMRDLVIAKIVECEANERDQRLLTLDHVLQCVLQEVQGKSVRTLIRSLT